MIEYISLQTNSFVLTERRRWSDRDFVEGYRIVAFFIVAPSCCSYSISSSDLFEKYGADECAVDLSSCSYFLTEEELRIFFLMATSFLRALLFVPHNPGQAAHNSYYTPPHPPHDGSGSYGYGPSTSYVPAGTYDPDGPYPTYGAYGPYPTYVPPSYTPPFSPTYVPPSFSGIVPPYGPPGVLPTASGTLPANFTPPGASRTRSVSPASYVSPFAAVGPVRTRTVSPFTLPVSRPVSPATPVLRQEASGMMRSRPGGNGMPLVQQGRQSPLGANWGDDLIAEAEGLLAEARADGLLPPASARVGRVGGSSVCCDKVKRVSWEVSLTHGRERGEEEGRGGGGRRGIAMSPGGIPWDSFHFVTVGSSGSSSSKNPCAGSCSERPVMEGHLLIRALQRPWADVYQLYAGKL